MAYYIKATEVIRALRRKYGRRASEEMLRDLSQLVSDRIDLWGQGRRGQLKKVQTWASFEDDLRLHFGGKRQLLRCWGCQEKKPEVGQDGHTCNDCISRSNASLGRVSGERGRP